MSLDLHLEAMTKDHPFLALPLIRSFIVLDMEKGLVLRHEVRRDPMTGLTLTRATPETTS